MTAWLESPEECVDRLIEAVGRHIVLGAPLGLGKPVQLINALYHRAEADSSLKLEIFTALSLERPRVQPGLEARLVEPVLERVFGDYQELAYMPALRAGTLPANIEVSEFYFKAGAMKGVAAAQRHYISSNYTHAARDMVNKGVNVVAHLLARRGDELSFSCNPDLSDHLQDLLEAGDRDCLFIGQVHPELPFMARDALVPEGLFDLVLDNRVWDRKLFSVPNAKVPLVDHAAALHASSLVVDGGTLQIGIGSLGDAVADALILRHSEHEAYSDMLDALGPGPETLARYRDRLCQGLYVSTEMFVNGMLKLIEAGIVSRPVYDDLVLQQGLNEGLIEPRIDERLWSYCRERGRLPRELDAAALAWGQHWGVLPSQLAIVEAGLELAGQLVPNDLDHELTRNTLLQAVRGQALSQGCILHGGFFLGPADFYRALREMPPERARQLCMTGVSRTNQLLEDVPLFRAQRRSARFINTGMMVSLSGAVASDGLEDGTVISGVGGQYNFVAMAHDLPGARSILCIRSTRSQQGVLQSNIVHHYGHTTIPRHLRDIVVTEYGIADLRGQSDEAIIKALIQIADSRFQAQLLQAAKASGKLDQAWQIPAVYCDNTPQRLARVLGPYRQRGLLPDFPFGSELSDIEQRLAAALGPLKTELGQPRNWWPLWRASLASRHRDEALQPYLARLGLDTPLNWRERLMATLVSAQLTRRGLC